MPIKPKTTWYLVCNGGHGRIFESTGPGAKLSIVKEMEADLEADMPRGTPDSRGRTFNRMGPGRSRMEGADPKAEAEKRFLFQCADDINKAALAGKFDRLSVVAPPRALGVLRPRLSKSATQLLAAEHARDLTHESPTELAKHLKAL